MKIEYFKQLVEKSSQFPRDIATGFVIDTFTDYAISERSQLKFFTLKNVVTEFRLWLSDAQERSWLYKQWYSLHPECQPKPMNQLAAKASVSNEEKFKTTLEALKSMRKMGLKLPLMDVCKSELIELTANISDSPAVQEFKKIRFDDWMKERGSKSIAGYQKAFIATAIINAKGYDSLRIEA